MFSVPAHIDNIDALSVLIAMASARKYNDPQRGEEKQYINASRVIEGRAVSCSRHLLFSSTTAFHLPLTNYRIPNWHLHRKTQIFF